MKVDWKNITGFRKVQVLSIEFKDDEVLYHTAKVSRKSKGVEINSIDIFRNSEDAQAYFNKLAPIIVHIYGKGVLNKIKSNSEENSNDFLMNSDPDNFYINKISIDDFTYISFTRKDKVDEELNSFSEFKENILNIYIGPFHTFLNEINAQINTTPIGKICKTEGKFNFIPDNSAIIPTFNQQALKHSFFAVISGTIFLLNKVNFGAYTDNIYFRKKSNFKDKLQFIYIGISALSFFLVALISNYFYQGHLNQKNADLEAKIMVYSQNLNKIDLIDQEVLRKKQLISNSGILRSNYFSKTLDEIGASVPPSINLEKMEIYPLEKKIKENVKPIFLKKTIKISGTAKSSENVNAWVNIINKMKWVKDVSIIHFDINPDKNMAFFELKIMEK